MDGKSQTLKGFPTWETHLVTRAQAGDTTAFELLAEMHRSAVTGQAMRMLKNSEDAQDAVQETFLKACKAIGTFQAGRPMLPWLMRICSNCCVDMIRARKANTDCIDTYEHALSDDKQDVASLFEKSVGAEIVMDAITNLPEKYREIVLMRHYKHMDVLEIADYLGKPEGTIKSWLFRARALLKKDLAPVISA